MKTPHVLPVVPLAVALALSLCCVWPSRSLRAEDAAAQPVLPLQPGTAPSASSTPLMDGQAPTLFAPPAPAENAPDPVPTGPLPVVAPSQEPATSANEAKPSPTPAKGPAKGTAEQLRQAIRIRELQTRVLRTDAEVNAQRALAERVRTPNGRRVAMRNYYTLLYTRMEKLDPSLKDPLERVLYQQLAMLEQKRLRPAPLIEAVPEVPHSRAKDHKPVDFKEEKPKKEETAENPE